MKLTQPQFKALAYLELYPDEWRYDTPVAKNCLRKLWEKKLIEIRDEDNPTGGRYLRRAKILPAGQVALINFRTSYGYSEVWEQHSNIEVRYNNKLGGWQVRVGGVLLAEQFSTEVDAIVAGHRVSAWGLRSDTWIRHMALTHDMITPYEPKLIEEGVISYGQSSYGYDIRVANVFKLYHNLRGGVIDPKKTRSDSYIDIEADYIEIPANSFVLARSIEYMRIPRNVLVLLLGKCVVGDTRVVSQDGSYRPINEIVQSFSVLSLADDQIKSASSSAVIHKGVQPVYTLKLKSGREIEATANHPFFTGRDTSDWISLSELKPGSRIAVARNIPVFGSQSLPDWETALLGLMISEGQCHTPNHSPCFTSEDPVLVSLLEQCCKTGLGMEVTDKGQNYGYRLVNHKGRGGVAIKNKASVWLEDYDLNVGAGEKFVPQEIFRSDRESTIIFLRALFSGDGSVYRLKNGYCLEYTSISKCLVEDVRHLLLRFQIESKVRAKHPKGGQTAWTLEIHKAACIIRFAQQIGFWPGSLKQVRLESFREGLQALRPRRSPTDRLPAEVWSGIDMQLRGQSYSTVGFHRYGTKRGPTYEEVEELYDAIGGDYLKLIKSRDLGWDEVVSIQPSGQKDVYDLSVAHTHNFVANDIVVHNSTYARCGLLLNFTPLEPDWEGFITVEISNTMPLPVKVYANEGIAQGLFFQSPDECEVSYGDREGKYHRAPDLELPKVLSREEISQRAIKWMKQNII